MERMVPGNLFQLMLPINSIDDLPASKATHKGKFICIPESEARILTWIFITFLVLFG